MKKMTYKQIDDLFNNMKQSCETILSLYKKQIYDYDKSYKTIAKYCDDYMNCINALLLFNMIDDEKHQYAYDLLNTLQIKFFDD